MWKQINNTVTRRRAAAENIFSQRLRQTSYSQRGVQLKNPISAFHLFNDEPLLCSIQKYAIKHGQADDKNIFVELCKLEKFISLQISHSVMKVKNTLIY